MKPLLLSVLLLLTGISFLTAGETLTDLERMQGIWQIVSLTEEGKQVPAKETDVLEVVIYKDLFSVRQNEIPVVQYSIKLDPTKTPKAIDFTVRPPESKDKKDTKFKIVTDPGIYSFEKGLLKLVIDEKGKGRPTAFEGKETATCSVMVLKRKSTAEKK